MRAIVRDRDGREADFSHREGTLEVTFDGAESRFECFVAVDEEDPSGIDLEFEERGDPGKEPDRDFHAPFDPAAGRLLLPRPCRPGVRRRVEEFNRDATPELLSWIRARIEETSRQIRKVLEFTMPVDRIVEGPPVPWGRVFGDRPAGKETIFASFRVTVHGTAWDLEDCFCVNPECECDQVLIRGARARGERRPGRARVEFEVAADLSGEIIEIADSRLPEAEIQEILGAWREETPDLEETLNDRYLGMKEIGERLFRKAGVWDREVDDFEEDFEDDSDATDPAPPAPLPSVPATGRNDPCPCGSGRKYKQCCAGKNGPEGLR